MIGKFLIAGAILLASLHAFASRALLDEVATLDKAADRAVTEIKLHFGLAISEEPLRIS